MSTHLPAIVVESGDSLPAPVPVYNPQQMVEALTRYRELQRALDRAMPDQIITIGGGQFRKRGYWRAVGVAFNLTLAVLEERRAIHGLFADGRENFGWLVTYRASSPHGRAAIGDGSCFAVEKAPRFRCPHPQATRAGRVRHHPPESCPDFTPDHLWRVLPLQATEHNIRAHAHTRAYNRAIANLVGFGETPAEELTAEEDRSGPTSRRRTPTVSVDDGDRTIDKEQQAQFVKVARSTGRTDAESHQWLTQRGIGGTAEIQQAHFLDLLDELQLDREPPKEG